MFGFSSHQSQLGPCFFSTSARKALHSCSVLFWPLWDLGGDVKVVMVVVVVVEEEEEERLVMVMMVMVVVVVIMVV